MSKQALDITRTVPESEPSPLRESNFLRNAATVAAGLMSLYQAEAADFKVPKGSIIGAKNKPAVTEKVFEKVPGKGPLGDAADVSAFAVKANGDTYLQIDVDVYWRFKAMVGSAQIFVPGKFDSQAGQITLKTQEGDVNVSVPEGKRPSIELSKGNDTLTMTISYPSGTTLQATLPEKIVQRNDCTIRLVEDGFARDYAVTAYSADGIPKKDVVASHMPSVTKAGL